MREITAVSEFTSSIYVPVNGTDGVTAESIEASIQPLTNRTVFLQDEISTGANKIATVANSTALKALTGVSDGSIRIVLATMNAYAYLASGTVSAETIMSYAATGMGAGGWYLLGIGAGGGAWGFALLDNNGELIHHPAGAYTTVDTVHSLTSLTAITTGEAFTSNLMTSGSLIAGDIVHVHASMIINAAGSQVTAQYQIGSGSWTSFSSRVTLSATYAGSAVYSLYDSFVAPSSASYSVRLYASPIGSTSYELPKANLRIVRP